MLLNIYVDLCIQYDYLKNREIKCLLEIEIIDFTFDQFIWDEFLFPL